MLRITLDPLVNQARRGLIFDKDLGLIGDSQVQPDVLRVRFCVHRAPHSGFTAATAKSYDPEKASYRNGRELSSSSELERKLTGRSVVRYGLGPKNRLRRAAGSLKAGL